MTRPVRPRPRTLGAALLLCVPLVAGAPTTAVAKARAGGASLTVEERRLFRPVPQEILRRSGFDSVGPEFAHALAEVRTYRQARHVVGRCGSALWRRAVDRAQGRGPKGGDLSRSDDRPLYWARLAMSSSLREWEPSFGLSQGGREALLDRLERTSRGEDSIDLPPGAGIKRVVVTGFDPFQLDADIRHSNPSGTSALLLDGRTISTPAGPARVETAVFPVRWADFTRGTVERTLLPHLENGPRRADAVVNVSQGSGTWFDVDRFFGAWRGGTPDNDNVSRTGTVPIPPWAPTVRPQPQWTTTTLPYEELVAARSRPFPVRDNTAVVEIPAGASEPVERPDGPTPGSRARAGGAGNYLANEIGYRSTLLRDALRLRIPGGHVHTPLLSFGRGNTDPATGRISDPFLVRERLAITRQVTGLVAIATSAEGPQPHDRPEARRGWRTSGAR
ncbi:pyroglutamyl peptidase [Streptomyces meridianus]|uniref:Pyroglutamyl peptidase n=1 Tax=Streptomyces meridianus TaxID=2938945 RepID=A0ABT0X2C4_9ACTN|nr:pyroglutamyl peptidase [Streptomyces meridianus]MCM2576688.1 pyroglutamyl peptidase [Streptomyces meridianus]